MDPRTQTHQGHHEERNPSWVDERVKTLSSGLDQYLANTPTGIPCVGEITLWTPRLC